MSRAQQANDRAAAFIIAQEDGNWNNASQAQLGAWLAESDGNKAAYWRLKHSWREADRISALGHGRADPGQESRPARRRWWVWASVAASIVIAIGGVYEQWPQMESPSQQIAGYQTAVGGLKDVTLSDGSHIQLNTASRVRTSLTAHRREAWLESGEAFFEVAHRSGAPFVVHAGDHQVTVLGTKFSLRREGKNLKVAVLEGRVRVDELKDGRPVRSAVIEGGDIAIAEDSALFVTSRSGQAVENALAWRQGMLEFNQAPLSEVAAEFNRYNKRQIVVTDPDAAGFRIGGMFPASNPDAFVRLLHDAYGLQVVTTDSEIKISS